MYEMDPDEIRWNRYPLVARERAGRRWLENAALVGLSPNTIDAYARALEEFLAFCERSEVVPVTSTRRHILCYLRDLCGRPSPKGAKVLAINSGCGLSNATLQQRLSAVRSFFDYAIEEGLRESNPVGRGRYTPSNRFGSRDGRAERSILPRYKKLPWIPSDEQWQIFLKAARAEGVRNRCMIGLAYDCGLRREELCLLRSEDFDPAYRLLRVRAETSKSRRDRTVPYSHASAELLRAYLAHRRSISRSPGALFLSESPRNRGEPITMWTWSKVVRAIADRAGLVQFSTHTFRHLCLTDLARAGWDVHEIAAFAGHHNPQTTQQYIHLSGRELSERLACGMEQIHSQRLRFLSLPQSEGEKCS